MVKNILSDTFLQKELVRSFPSYFSSFENLEEELRKPFIKILVYVIDNKILGFLNYSLIYDRIELNFIEVLNDYRDQHIGSYLLEEMFKESVVNYTLEVRSDNFSAIHLYEKYGFVKKAVRTKYYHGVDGYLMEKEGVLR